MVPSRVQAISSSQSTSREWLVAIRCSRRSSIHFTGRPTWRRRERDQEILGIELAAHAEAAADIELDHVDGGLGDAQHGRQRAAVEEQDLGRAEHREPAFRRVPFGDQAARLQRQSGQAVAAKALACACIPPWRMPRRHRRTPPHSAPRGCCRSPRTAAIGRSPPRAGPAPPAAARCRRRSPRARPRRAPGVSATTTASGSPT